VQLIALLYGLKMLNQPEEGEVVAPAAAGSE
jgi:hypothetical protein